MSWAVLGDWRTSRAKPQFKRRFDGYRTSLSNRNSIGVGIAMESSISRSIKTYSATLRTNGYHREKHRELEPILALSWANEGNASALLRHVGSSWGALEPSGD